VACLSRALLLLFRSQGGEACLHQGHGLKTVLWKETISGDHAQALEKLSTLKIKTCEGLFTDFVRDTNNTVSLHISSGAVDGRQTYAIPASDLEISLADLFSRIPDLRQDYKDVHNSLRYADIGEIAYNESVGFQARIRAGQCSWFRDAYENLGYSISCEGDQYKLVCSAETFASQPPMFMHEYVNKMFGAIPRLYITEPLPNGARYSELAMLYMVSYMLGMLVRYYPTHWMSLVQGDNGDAIWPTLNRAQHCVETTYPELVAEMISYTLKIGGSEKSGDSS
jgi:hypothetical protein